MQDTHRAQHSTSTDATASLEVGEDKRLVRAVAGGDDTALAALYDRYSSLMLAVGFKVLRDRREAEDLLHDVFLQVWHKAADYDPSRGTVRTWLLLRTRSRALDQVRSARLARRSDADVDVKLATIASDDDVEGNADRARVRQALVTLEPELRDVLLLAYFEGMSSSEIGTRLGIPTGTVKSRTAKARRHLSDLLLPSHS